MPEEITQRLGFDASSAIEQLKKLQASLNTFKQGLQSSAAALNRFPAKATPAIQSLRQLTNDAIKASAALTVFNQSTSGQNKLAQESQAAGKAVNKMGTDAANAAGKVQNQMVGATEKAAKSVKTLGTSMQSAAQTTQREGAKVVATSGQVQSATKQVGDEAKNTANTFTISWKTIGRIIAAQVVIRGLSAVVSAFKEAQQQAVEFSLAIGEISTISGEALGGLNEISDAVLELSLRTGLATADVAEGLYQTLSNQVVEAGDAIRFEEQAAKLAITTHSDLKDAVNALSSVMNSYNLDISEVENVSAVLFKTIELGRLRLDEFGSVLGRVAPLTQALGVSYQEMAAAIAALTQKGVPAHTAITQLTQVSQKLLRPTEKLQALYHEWGVETGPEAIARFGGLTGVLLKMKDATAGNDKEFADLLGRVRAMVGALNLTTAEANALTEAMDQMKEPIGAFNKALESMESTAGRRAVRAWDNLEVSMVKAGKEIIKITTPLVELMGLLARNFTDVVAAATVAGIAALAMAGKLAFLTGATWSLTAASAALSATLLTILPIAIAVAAALAAMQLNRALLDSLDKSAEVTDKFAKAQEELTEVSEERATKETKILKKEFEERARFMENFLTNEAKLFDKHHSLVESESKAIGNVLTSTLENLFAQREKMIKGMREAILGTDDAIKESMEVIKDTARKLADSTFERSISGLSPEWKAQKALARAKLTANKANEAYAKAGTDREKRQAALELSNLAEKQTNEAQAFAEKSGNLLFISKFEEQQDSVLNDRARNEANHIHKLSALNTTANKKNLEELELAGERAKVLAKEYSDLLDETDKSTRQIEIDTAKAKDLEPELARALNEAFKGLDIFANLDIEKSMQKLKGGVVRALSTAKIDWRQARLDFEAEMKNASATVRLIADNPELADTLSKVLKRPVDPFGKNVATDIIEGTQLIEEAHAKLTRDLVAGNADIQNGLQSVKERLSAENWETWASVGKASVRAMAQGTWRSKEALDAWIASEKQLLGGALNQELRDMGTLLEGVGKQGKTLNDEERALFDLKKRRAEAALESGSLETNQYNQTVEVLKTYKQVLNDLDALVGKAKGGRTDKIIKGAAQAQQELDDEAKSYNATQKESAEGAKNHKEEVQGAAVAGGNLGEALKAPQQTLEEMVITARKLKAELQGSKGEANQINQGGAGQTVPPSETTQPATEVVPPEVSIPSAAVTDLSNKLTEVEDKAAALEGSVSNVGDSFVEAATAGTQISTAVDNTILSTGNLEAGAAAVNTQLIEGAGNANTLDTSIQGAATSTGEAAVSSVDLNTGLNGAAASADAVRIAMNGVAVAAQQAAQAIALAASAGSGVTVPTARNGGPMARYFANGGPLSRGHDNRMIMAQDGERIVGTRNARRFASELQAMNAGSNPVYRDHGGPVTNVGDISVSVSQGETPSQTARDLVSAIRRELRRGTSRLN